MPSSATSADLPPFLATIADWVARAPDVDALLCEGERLSFGELWARAQRTAGQLSDAGLHPGDRVALRGSRTPAQYVAMLGVLLAGGIYIPLGERSPPARQDYIIGQAKARFLLHEGVLEVLAADAAPDATILPAGYLLFTSGTTGTPKGVRIGIDNIDAYIPNQLGHYPIHPGARVAQLADLGFDVSVHEIFSAWCAGATVQVVPMRNAILWPRYFKSFDVEYATLVPTQVRLAAQHGILRPDSLPKLRRVILGAELVTGHVVRLIRDAAPQAELVNQWGPTEGTIFLTHHPIEGTPPDAEGVPIGRPWPGHTDKLDDPIDGIGEFLIAGPQLCHGYWQAPERTAERFVEEDGHTFYRSGDLARYDAGGALVFLGRRDRQVKIKGYRVELEEIELVMRRLSSTDTAVAQLIGDELIAFVAPHAIEGLEESLRDTLPSHMIPARFVPVTDFPMTASGKVDLAALRALTSAPTP